MKLKRWKIITAASLAVVLLLTVAISVYAYFSTRVYVYTEDGKEILHVGMNLQLLFDKLEGDTAKGEGNYVPADTVIDIPWYETVLNTDGTPTGEYIYHESATYNKDAPWGTPQNPYVISDIKHLQNLSALQNVGYFELMYVGDDFNGTSPNFSYNNGVAMPYFVVSTKLGTPVVINAVGSPEFRPIGSSAHPFIGVIGGAFVDGVATLPNGNTSTNSVIHGAQVYTTTNAVDVGLFGYIGYLGTEPTDEQIEAGSDGFDGAASVIQDLLISDVQIRVSKPSVTEIISDYFASILGANHNYTYTALPEDNQAQVFHETHHIGIFAGHVSYASLKNISVYYSNEELYAIDLVAADTAADNYHTSTGIVGFMYNMGAEIENVSGLHCQVKLGGTSSDGASVPSSGTGTGGGALSGSGRGYVTAAEIFTEYNYLESGTIRVSGNANLLDYKTSGADTWVTGALLIYEALDANSNKTYTLADGVTPVTVSGTSVTDGTTTWNKYIVRTGTGTASDGYKFYTNVDRATEVTDTRVSTAAQSNFSLWNYHVINAAEWVTGAILLHKQADNSYTLSDNTTVVTVSGGNATVGGESYANFFIRANSTEPGQKYVYYAEDGTSLLDNYEMTGSRQNGQVIWRYSAGGSGIWHYGVRVFETVTGGNATYTLDDVAKTPVIVDLEKGIATKTDGSYTWGGFLLRTGAGTDTSPYVYYDSTKTNIVTSFNRKALTLIDAKNAEGEDLCTEWIRNRLLWGTEATGMYYFYDGVFTFALSSEDDTIRDTWANDTAPTIYLGKNDSAQWTSDYATGNQAVIALLDPVTSNAELDAAIAAKKQFYISARPNGLSTEALLLSLLTTNKSTTEAGAITGTMLELNESVGDSVKESYQSGLYNKIPVVPVTGSNDEEMSVTLDQLRTDEFWDQYKILNIGATSDELPLSTLRQKYNVAAENKDTIYYFRADTGVQVTPAADGLPTYETWDGFFYYEYSIVASGILGWRYDHTYTFYYHNPHDGIIVEIGKVTANDIWNSTIDYDRISNFTGIVSSDTSSEITGEPLYNAYVDPETGETLTVSPCPLVNKTDNVFNQSSNQSYINGSKLSKLIPDAYEDYYCWDSVTDTYYKVIDGVQSNMTEDEAEVSALPRINKYKSYAFKDALDGQQETSYLQIMRQYTSKHWLTGQWSGSRYSIWAGADSQYSSLENKYPNNGQGKESVLVFVEGQEYCYIKYTLNAASQYVNFTYDSTNKSGTFAGNVNNSNADTRLYVYVIEGIVDMNWGVNTFKPKGTEGTDYHALSAGEYVLWPQHTLMQDGTYNRYITVEEGSTQRTVVSNRLNTTQNASMLVTNDPTYKVVSLAELNWTNENGVALGSIAGFGLTQKFQMADQAGFGPMLNLLNGNIELGDEPTQLVAPIGSEGVEANIPKGCVAFRVNEIDPTEPNTVRIIVAIPTTNLYVGEGGFDLDLLNDYYIGLWNVEASGDNFLQTFSKADAVEKFELPRSYVYEMGITAKDADDAVPAGAIYKNYITTEYGGSQYRTYLNGGCVLVAYEFIVDAVGVYVIGSAHGDDTTETQNFPMEIVHFSVSGTASAGRDGVGGSKTGSIDFVYDYSGKVMTVGTWGNDNDGGVEDYAQNYYVSQCILFTENNQKVDSTTFANLNKFKFKVRRYIDPTSGKSTIKLIVTADTGDIYNQNSMQISRYSVFADDTIRDPAVVATGAE